MTSRKTQLSCRGRSQRNGMIRPTDDDTPGLLILYKIAHSPPWAKVSNVDQLFLVR
jgi:hypothetical protein